MTSEKLRKLFIDFFKGKGHTQIPSASIIPENDPTVLFTTAGMHPLVPYLTGEKHPQGTRLTNSQKCIRTDDIEEVGDDTHLTFFEMLGNWSLGDYFKKEAITYSFEFLTAKECLNLPLTSLAFSVFLGDDDAPRDTESAEIWKSLGVKDEQIFYLPKKQNWWGPAGITGPCGPDTEMFIDTGKEKCTPDCSPACDCGKYIEIWNDVFMQYFKNVDGTFSPLTQKNVDTGMGLERAVCVLSGKNNVYETDLFETAIKTLEKLSGKSYKSSDAVTRAMRIIADHIRAAVFMIGDKNGLTPSNTDQGYVLRRLIRRSIRQALSLEIPHGFTAILAEVFINVYKDVYPELPLNAAKITSELLKEEERFNKTLTYGIKEFEKVAASNAIIIDGVTAFRLYDTYGFPIEITVEMAKERGLTVDIEGYNAAYSAHQQKSQAGSEQRFKGGLLDASQETTNLHTATHLLHTALKKVLGDKVAQRGSNITAERLRFDFSFDRPMTTDEIKEVEDIVNAAINAAVKIECKEMSVAEAKSLGAIGLFEDKYGDVVKVFVMGDFSVEICGGPHAENTGELGTFKIAKEQSSSSGVRRIRAELKEKN